MKDSKEQTQGDILEAGKEDWKVIPKKQEMTTQMRVEKGKTRDTARRKERAATKDRLQVQMPETKIVGKYEDYENYMNIAEQFEEWLEKYHIA